MTVVTGVARISRSQLRTEGVHTVPVRNMAPTIINSDRITHEVRLNHLSGSAFVMSGLSLAVAAGALYAAERHRGSEGVAA